VFFHSDAGWSKYRRQNPFAEDETLSVPVKFRGYTFFSTRDNVVLHDGEQVLINYQDPHFVDLLQVNDGGYDATEEEVMEVIDKHQQQCFLQSYSPRDEGFGRHICYVKDPSKEKDCFNRVKSVYCIFKQ
jgi:hypothetical protein